MEMKKTSVYLSDEDRERLVRLAERQGKSQAWVIREALLAYDASLPDRNYAMFDLWKDIPPGTVPHFDDPQEFADWVDAVVKGGMDEDYEQQKRDDEEWAKSRRR
jgi:hypothetical protein